MPAFEDILGNHRLRERLENDIRADRLSHAYILEGADGFGKHMLASRIAAALECERKTEEDKTIPCGVCPPCKKILSGNSPDVIYVNRGEKATLGVDVIRAMHTDVYVAPNECENKVYIIEEAHLMTEQAQNAFLLTLEEPPSYVRFFLLCNHTESLLETVKSRAPILRMQPIPWNEIGNHLLKTERTAKELQNQSAKEFEELLISANGSVGTAKTLLDPRRRKSILECREAAKAFISFFNSRRNSLAVMNFFNGLARQKRDEIIRQLNEIELCIRDLFLCKQSEQAPLCFFTEREEAISVSYRFSSPELLQISDGLETAVDRLQANANTRLTLHRLAIEIGLLS